MTVSWARYMPPADSGRGACGILVTLLVIGCSSPTGTEAGMTSRVSLNVVHGDAQSGPVNTRLPQPIRVQVLNSAHQPVPNFLLDFVVTSGGGSVFGGAEITNSEGFADEQWTLGPRLGRQTLEAREVNSWSGVAASYGEFSANATPPNNVLVVTTTGPTGLAVMNADGSGFRPINIGGLTATEPALSPDHTHVLFEHDVMGFGGIDEVNVNGSGLTQVSLVGDGPMWSPDGVDYLWDVENQNGGLFRSTNGFGQNFSFCAGNQWSYSADGTKVLYSFTPNPDCVDSLGNSAVNPGVYVVALANQVATELIANGKDPAWSPDGQHIAFTLGGHTAVMDPDGNNVKLTQGNFGLVSWSPDSQLWAVDSGFVNSDGTNYVKVTGCPCRFAWR